jgi:hypothetical protein
VDEAGEVLLDARGLGQMRYKAEDERTYTVRPERIRPLEEPADAVDVWPVGLVAGDPPRGAAGVLLRWRGREREISRPLGPCGATDAAVGALLAALAAIRRPEVPVRIHAVPPAEAAARLGRALERFPDLTWAGPRDPAPGPEQARAEALARRALAAGPRQDDR